MGVPWSDAGFSYASRGREWNDPCLFCVRASTLVFQIVVVFDGDAANTIKPTWAIRH